MLDDNLSDLILDANCSVIRVASPPCDLHELGRAKIGVLQAPLVHVALSLVLRVQWSWARLGFPLSLKSEVQRYPVLPHPHPHWCRLGHSMERLSGATPLKTSECGTTKDMAREVWGFPMNV